MILSLWARYFFKETLKVFFLFIVCFYGLYILIDFSSHSTSFHHQVEFKWREIGMYYLCDFIKRSEVIVPFAVLIATIKTLCSLNIHNELVALMASGIKLKALLRPFVILGLCFTALLYFNTEFLMPMALKHIKMIDSARSKQKNKANKTPMVQHLVLENETLLLFQDYDPAKERFVDAYWVRSIDDVYRMKYLYPFMEKPLGEYVDKLQRTADGKLVVEDSQAIRILPELSFNSSKLTETLTQPLDLSITVLREKMPIERLALSEKEAQTLSVLYYKLAMPWLCLLAVIGPAPFCVRFTRQLPVFFIYACSIFGLVAFYLVMDAALILGSRQVLNPEVAIFTPFLLFFGIFSFRYTRLTT